MTVKALLRMVRMHTCVETEEEVEAPLNITPYMVMVGSDARGDAHYAQVKTNPLTTSVTESLTMACDI